MAFDPGVGDQLTAMLLTNAQHAMGLNQMADRNLTQGLGVVNTALIQSGAATADDAQLMAALQTASRVPAQGANDLPK